jgi:hypothetical protein
MPAVDSSLPPLAHDRQHLNATRITHAADGPGFFAVSADNGIHENRIAGFAATRFPAWLSARGLPLLYGVTKFSEGGTMKTALLNSVGIILVIAACLMVCVALNTVS